MQPNTFLRSFWRLNNKPQVFVAMSFDSKYQKRFDDVIKPAIESLVRDGVPMTACRVDLSRTGDSILTDINDGIVHSALVLADVSSIGVCGETGGSYRNANVLYEVGIALASRQAHEVLLVRDDNDKFLFDVSTIPHATIDFGRGDESVAAIAQLLQDRLDQAAFIHDARVQLTISRLTSEEIYIIRSVGESSLERGWGKADEQRITQWADGLPRLLGSGIIVMDGTFREGHGCYKYTELGLIVSRYVLNELPMHKGTQTNAASSSGRSSHDKS